MNRTIQLLVLTTLLTSCSDGLLGGAITAQFSGINKATILGPETISIDWKTDPKCDNYQVYSLTSSTSQSLVTTTVPPVILRDPNISSEHSYTLAVGCIRDGISTGLDVAVNASTWKAFDGNLAAPEVLPGGQFRLTWDYLPSTGTKFLIYALESTVPGIEQKLTPVDSISYRGYRRGYQDEPICTTYNNRLVIGSGGDCAPSATQLKAGSLYQFRIVAQYPDNNFSEDITGHYQSKLIDSTFTPPNCTLTHQGMGADESSTYLYLRCAASNACPNMTAKAFQGVSGLRKAASDTMSISAGSANLLQIQATPGQNPNNDRLVENLEIEFTCTQGVKVQKAVIRYDGTQLQYPKPLMKFGNSTAGKKYELPPEQSFQLDPRAANVLVQAPSKMGTVTAAGDFDCDGNPDLAVGLPEITYNLAPYFNEASESGAVKIFYNYTKSASGSITAANGVQILSFRDLATGAHFGASLSSGNINRDVYRREGDVYYSCDDLVIGAPGDGSAGEPGRAFVFYGQPQKFPQQPLNFKDLSKNSATCGGNFDSQTCAPVELTRATAEYFRINPESSNRNNTGSWYSEKSIFGYKVSYVGDFDADGYGDVVVTDPNCHWDGYIVNNDLGYLGGGNFIPEVGCMYVYFGGPSGLQAKPVAKAPDSSGTNPYFTNLSLNGTSMTNIVVSPFIKVYPPIPQANMHFGKSISGGGDIDGRLPVPVQMPGGGVILATGSDFVVGAPDFNYKSASFNGTVGTVTTSPWSLQTTENDSSGSQDPFSIQFSTSTTIASPKFIPPLNKAWAPTSNWQNVPLPTTVADTTKGLYNSTGIAFAYLGRHSFKPYNLKMKASSGISFFPLGDVLISGGSEFIGSLLDQFSHSVRDRQNGSALLQFDNNTANINDSHISPIRGFYNCGVRGSPRQRSFDPTNNSKNDYYDHFSCLAGRNNFSVMFPTISDSDTAVKGFGSNVAVMGSKEQNAVALYNLTDSLGESAFVSPTSTVANQLFLLYQAQGKIHDRIRGTALWEVGVKDFHASGLAGDLSGTDLSNPNTSVGQISLSIKRASLKDELIMKDGNASIINSPAGGSKQQTDLNRDGYADVAVSSATYSNKSSLFTFFGNHAADFAYTYKNASLSSYVDTGANCSIDRPAASAPSAGTNSTNNFDSGVAFKTYQGKAVAYLGTKKAWLTSEFPVTHIPNSYGYVAFLNQSSSMDLNYQNRPALAGTPSCKPQLKLFNSAPQSMMAADLDYDGITDLAVGFPDENNGQGKASGILGGQSGNGLAMEQVFNVSEVGARFGSAVTALNWKFITPVLTIQDPVFNESVRREMWVGSRGYGWGAGGVFNYKASGDGVVQLSLNTSAPFTDNSNTPNALYAERSSIIGDINGDGYDDIWTPIKRKDQSGDDYFDAMIYFGSPFGPVTNSFCKQNYSKMSYSENSGSGVASSECFGSVSSMPAYMNGVQIHLPQYILKSTAIGYPSLLNVFPAGDVNLDGKADVLVFDKTSTADNLYLYFGSDSGLVNGAPIPGPSSNRVPQLVSTQAPIPTSSWAYEYNTWNSYYGRPVVHGDFNGDHHEDLAFSIPSTDSPTLNGQWGCVGFSGNQGDPNYSYCTPTTTGPSIQSHGIVVVIYGGPYGYQVSATNSYDLAHIPKCDNFLENCTLPSTMHKEVYGTLAYNSAADEYSFDLTKLTCDPTLSPGENCNGLATVIRNPAFYNTDYSFSKLSGGNFGGSLAVGDFNGDGIVDLAVGAPRHSLPDFEKSSFSSIFAPGAQNDQTVDSNTLYGKTPGSTTTDVDARGSVFVYYGSHGGVVAPKARTMLGDNGLGLYRDGGTAKSNDSHLAFALSPPQWQSIWGMANATKPERDPIDANPSRRFGMSITSGDFNGDGVADLAASTIGGQVYVYYGPICGTDNAPEVWKLGAYAYHNATRDLNSVGLMLQGNCKTMNLNRDSGGPSTFKTADPSTVAGAPKDRLPQMIYVNGVQAGSKFGSTLISAMPKRGGNIDGDPGKLSNDGWEGTSDLIIAGNNINDPNVTTTGGKSTGMGYVLFGHKKALSPDDMVTTPGLYFAQPSYNLSIAGAADANGVQVFHKAPITLKPYESDGSVTGFFLYPSSLGDLNGDRTGDLLLPTSNLNLGADNTTKVINGGGYKLIY